MSRGLTALLAALLVLAVGGGAVVAAATGDVATLARPSQEELPRAPGQFVVACEFSHALLDDPIVAPGQPGLSHRHDFFGNTEVDAFTEWHDLPGGDTSCEQKLDTASYWSPSLYVDDEPVEPLAIDAYYRAGPGVDPETVVAYPEGLAMVAGDPAATEPQHLSIVGWACGRDTGASTEPEPCDNDLTLNFRVNFPDCWDGERADSDDDQAHTAYSAAGTCPTSHPVPIPQLTYVVHFPNWVSMSVDHRLASGSVLTGHADFLNGWDQAKLEREVSTCIARAAVCGVPYGSLNGL